MQGILQKTYKVKIYLHGTEVDCKRIQSDTMEGAIIKMRKIHHNNASDFGPSVTVKAWLLS